MSNYKILREFLGENLDSLEYLDLSTSKELALYWDKIVQDWLLTRKRFYEKYGSVLMDKFLCIEGESEFVLYCKKATCVKLIYSLEEDLFFVEIPIFESCISKEITLDDFLDKIKGLELNNYHTSNSFGENYCKEPKICKNLMDENKIKSSKLKFIIDNYFVEPVWANDKCEKIKILNSEYTIYFYYGSNDLGIYKYDHNIGFFDSFNDLPTDVLDELDKYVRIPFDLRQIMCFDRNAARKTISVKN